jgi:hypothetical protein
MDALSGLVSLIWFVLKWLGWKLVCGYLPGFRMYALHRWPADVELSHNQPQSIAAMLDVSVPPVRPQPFQPQPPFHPQSLPPIQTQPPPAARPSPAPPRSSFRITSDPIRSAPPPVAPQARVTSDPLRPQRGPRLRTKGAMSAPGKCPSCLTVGKVVSAGGEKWRCQACDFNW